MSYTVNTKQEIAKVPKGQQAEVIKRNGKTMYRFRPKDNNSYFICSWKYVQDNKDKFDISRSNK